MNKQAYMLQLKRALEPLKQSAQQEILADFEEHFANGQASGKTEDQVAEELGSPKELAQQYILEAEETEKKALSTGNIGRSIMAAFGLILLDLIIVIPIAAGVFGAIIGLWAVPISIGASSAALLFLPLFGFGFIPYWLTLIIAISLLGLAVAMSIGMFYLSKYFIKFVVKYAKAHYSIIAGGQK